MKVSELIEKLSDFDPDREVSIVFDGADRMDVQKVWYAVKGSVLLSDANHTVYNTRDRPPYAPTTEEDPYWSTEQIP